jgi:hypothetical protein
MVSVLQMVLGALLARMLGGADATPAAPAIPRA